MAENEKPELPAEEAAEGRSAPKKKSATKKKVAAKKAVTKKSVTKKKATVKKAAVEKAAVEKSVVAGSAAEAAAAPTPVEAPVEAPAKAPAPEAAAAELARREALQARLAKAGVMVKDAPAPRSGPTLTDHLFKVVVVAGLLAIAWYFYVGSEGASTSETAPVAVEPVSGDSAPSGEAQTPAVAEGAGGASGAPEEVTPIVESATTGDAVPAADDGVAAVTTEEPAEAGAEESILDTILSAILVGRGSDSRAERETVTADGAAGEPRAATVANEGAAAAKAEGGDSAAAVVEVTEGARTVVSAPAPVDDVPAIPDAPKSGGDDAVSVAAAGQVKDDGLYYPEFAPWGGYYYGPVYYYNPWYYPAWGPWGPGWW